MAGTDALVGPATGRLIAGRRLVEPLRIAPFRRLAAGRLVSHFGDWLTLAALIGWLYGTSGSTAEVALLMVLRLAPPILGSGLAVMVVDRLPKERLIVWVSIARGVAVAAALAGLVLEERGLIFCAFAFSGALAAVSNVTVSALVPSLLPADKLPAANAGIGIAQEVAMALGALCAGIALSLSTAATALGVDLATFALATALFWGIRLPAQSAARAGESGPAGDFGSSFRYILGRRVVLAIIVAFGAAVLATGLTNATLPRFLDVELGLGPGAYAFGIAALACGLACGQALVGVARPDRISPRSIGWALVLMSGLFAALAVTEQAAIALLILALIGFADGTTEVIFETVVQREIHPRYYGRVFGLASAFMGTMMLGSVAAAPLVNGIASPQSVIAFAGVFLLVAAGFALVGTRRPGPAPARALSGGVGSR